VESHDHTSDRYQVHHSVEAIGGQPQAVSGEETPGQTKEPEAMRVEWYDWAVLSTLLAAEFLAQPFFALPGSFWLLRPHGPIYNAIYGDSP
jgi:hypothetical protein